MSEDKFKEVSIESDISKQERDASRAWFDEKMKNVDPDKFYAAANRAFKRRDAFAQAMKSKVWYKGVLVDENPEYLQRARDTKMLIEQLKAYSGSPELASDLLFEAKKEADALGKDFGVHAKEKSDEMKGYNIVGPEIQFKPIEVIQPKRSLAGRIAHKLWKMGFPIDRFIKKGLDTEEADKK